MCAEAATTAPTDSQHPSPGLVLGQHEVELPSVLHDNEANVLDDNEANKLIWNALSKLKRRHLKVAGRVAAAVVRDPSINAAYSSALASGDEPRANQLTFTAVGLFSEFMGSRLEATFLISVLMGARDKPETHVWAQALLDTMAGLKMISDPPPK
jgi:hypothetical protein